MRKRTHEEFVDFVHESTGEEYEVLGHYINSKVKILMKHNKCGYEWETKPIKFTIGRRCPKCAGKEKITNQAFFDMLNGEYSALEEIKTKSSKVLIRHNKCGYEWLIQPGRVIRERMCRNCSEKIKMTTASFSRRVKEVVGEEYTVLGDYASNKRKVLMRHNECNYEWTINPNGFLSGNRCPSCRGSGMSKGEKAVLITLEQLGVNYTREYRIEKCRNIVSLPFDFAVFDKNEIAYLIEYQGIQHYRPVEYWGGEESFRKTKINDEIKRVFCEENNIPLIAIPYTEKDIKRFLLDELAVVLSKQLELTF